jgi:hypothetical protein
MKRGVGFYNSASGTLPGAGVPTVLGMEQPQDALYAGTVFHAQ